MVGINIVYNNLKVFLNKYLEILKDINYIMVFEILLRIEIEINKFVLKLKEFLFEYEKILV